MKQLEPYKLDEKKAAVADLCRTDLKFLCTQFLGYKDWDLVHDDVEELLRKPSRKKALLLPRGHLKSTLVTVAYSIQQIIRNPNVRILIANQVWDMSRSFLREIKAQLEASQLKYLFGEFTSPKWNEDLIVLRQRTKPLKEPTILTTGVEAETTGGHFDVIFLDDLTGLQNSATPEQREKTKRFRRSMINLLEPGGVLIEIGTRWHLDDTFSVIMEKEARYYDLMIRKVVENGKIIFPKHFSKKFDIIKKDWVSVPEQNCMDYIQHLKESMPIDEYMAQYENNPISSENQMFKEGMFKYWTKRPEGLYVAMAVDLAISQQTDADYTAITVLGMDKDWNIYVLDYLRGHWLPADIIRNVFDMESRWKPHAVGMETNGFQRILKTAVEEEMRRNNQYFGIGEIRNGPERSKESRIKSLEPFYRRGAVFHSTWMKGKELETELLTFPKGRNDDLCFVAGTKIATPTGERSIEDLRPGDFVITPFGIRRVLAAKETGENEVVEKHSLTGTPSHPVFVYGKGFSRLDALTMVEPLSRISKKELLQWKYRKLLISMESSTGLWAGRGAITLASLVPITGGRIRRDFTSRFMSFIADRKFRKAFTFIIKTATLLTTTLATWNAFQLGNIYRFLKKSTEKRLGRIWKGFVHWLQNGILPEKALNGTRVTVSDLGGIGPNVTSPALPVGADSSLSLNLVFADPTAERSSGQNQESTKSGQPVWLVVENSQQTDATKSEFQKPVADVAVGSWRKTEKTYNITVENDLVYFANGVLVSNCDAMAMTLPMLSPGTNISAQEPGPGTYDYVLRQAQRYNSGRSFFDHGG